MKKTAAIIISIVLVLTISAGAIFWYMMSQPIYQPGSLRSAKNLRYSLAPPPQTGAADFWMVEPDIHLYHFSQGEGKNVLIIHGGPGQPYRERWPGLTPLEDEFRFNYYDQRGSGDSTRPVTGFESNNYYDNITKLDLALGISAQIADIERIRQILGEAKLTLIGHSFGGFLASLYAAEFPENVEALVLIAPADMLVMPQETEGGLFELVRQKLPAELQNEYDQYIEEYLNFQDIFSKTDRELVELNKKFSEYYMIAAGNTSLQEKNDAEPGGWMTHAMYLSMGTRHDYRQALKVVDAPVLVIHGTNDLQPEVTSRVYAELFPNTQFQTIENAGHFPFYTHPEEFAEAAGQFLARVH
jgi:proline iminopeptidase